MRKLKVLALIPLLLLTGCKSLDDKYPDLSDYEKVHIYEVGCIPTSDCELISVEPATLSDNVDIWLKYKSGSSNEFVTTNFALVKGRCPICKKQRKQ